MKIKRKAWIVFLAVMFTPLTIAAGFADTNVGDYTLGGYISLGGGWLSDQPRHMNRGYLKEYLPFPEGFLAYTDLTLKSKDGLEYYRFWMSHPGLTDQDFALVAGKLGVYHAEIEYDQLQHLYCTVNPFDHNIGILVQRLRFSGYYLPTPDIAIFAENQFLRRTGQQPASYSLGGGTIVNPYNFTTYIRPIDYSQNDLKAGVEYDRPTYQFRMAYHLSSFENGTLDVMGRPTANDFVALPPSNIAHYLTAEGAVNLLAYKTRLAGSFSYGWLTDNDLYINRAGATLGDAGLGARTVAAYLSGVTRPYAPLTLRYSYSAYDYNNNNLSDQLIARAFSSEPSLLNLEHYSWLRQTVKIGADYRVNSKLAVDAAYAFQRVDRTNEQGHTTNNSPQLGIRFFPNDWLNLMANYAYVSRVGTNFLVADPITYKTYSGNLIRNKANFVAEMYPANNVTCSANFSFYNDNFQDSTFGLQSDRGWSTGVDVCWRPHDRVALSLGYDHQQLQTKELVSQSTGPPAVGALVTGDAGSILTTSDSYDTFVARVDIKLIPNKLNLTSRGSYSFASSDYHNSLMSNLNEYYADIRTFLTYRYDEHWGCRLGYVFQAFGLPKDYQTLYLTGIPAQNQRLNTLGGYYTNATAHIVQAFLQYKF